MIRVLMTVSCYLKNMKKIFDCTTLKMKFSVKDFLSKCDQIRWKLRIWSHLLNKSLMESFNFCAVLQSFQQVLDNYNLSLEELQRTNSPD